MRASETPSAERSPSLPGRRVAQDGLARLRQSFAAAPLPLKIILVIALCVFVAPATAIAMFAGLVYAPYALWAGRRDVAATASVALWGVALTAAFAHGPDGPRYLLLVLPVAVALAAHPGKLGHWFAPCRTVAWTLGWALPLGIITFHLLRKFSYAGPAVAWVVAALVLAWRLARAHQGSQEQIRQQARGGAPGVPYPWSPAGPLAGAAARPGRAPASRGPAARPQAPGTVRVAQADGVRGQPGPDAGQQALAEQPVITIDEAMAELDAMIGLAAVKDQVRSIAASVEAARRRALAGHGTEKPMQHFVFLGPPGTGKTAVARVIAKIFYAFGLLNTPAVVEAHRADLVGEYLGATAIKTNELIDSALGGVLFIDEAYSLVNEGDGQGDRFGNEAVQALLKRAEDNREDLIIILAGYERQMDSFLATNPGLNSRFGNRIKFPGYSPAELLALADLALETRGELLDPDARPVLRRMFEEVGRRRLADELGNGRFVRNLLTKAGQRRDVRVMAGTTEPSQAELVTIRGADLEQAYADLTTRFRGYGETPTVASALAELDALVGLEPVKRQVHEIAAQLQVARLRDRQGLASQPPARHFVFTGPPGTGKTTVARILGRIFAALGLLVRPEVVEAHRADLVGEHLGSTAIKTNKLIDSALGGVLFIDEAYALYNQGYSGGDAFGSEAVATLLKRAEDDRDRLVIVLAGYTDDMDRFLRSNPGLASRFSVRIAFPSYSPAELASIAESIATGAGDFFAADTWPLLAEIFSEASAQGRIDELGNGRFARSLFERACAARDLRVADLGDDATTTDLTTVTADDLQVAARELGR
ncbi:MAG TPA: AAA family ATPase [Streptosporangiaceae bacterium]|nr:AAA family ATPase [Streptosporangiaceae bacterium]